MIEKDCCCPAHTCDPCLIEVSSTPALDLGATSSQYVLFDDAALIQNQITESPVIPVARANTARIAGVVINRTAAATISFNVLVSTDGETWVLLGSFNVNNVGYFTSNALVVNAQFIKCRAATASAAIVVFGALLELMER